MHKATSFQLNSRVMCYIRLSLMLFGFIMGIRSALLAQMTSKPVGKAVMLRDATGNDREIYFFPSESVFDLFCRVAGSAKPGADTVDVNKTDIKAIGNGAVKISSGTQAVELSRINHFKRVDTQWIGKVHIRVSNGTQKGKEGYVLAECVFPLKERTAKKTTKDYPIVSIYDTSLDYTFLYKSRKVFDLGVRATAGIELTHEEEGIIVHGIYKLTGRIHARLISSKDHIPTPDGRYVGYSNVELTDGPYKGKQGLVFIEQVHK